MFNFTDVGDVFGSYTLFECFLAWPSLHPFTEMFLVIVCSAMNTSTDRQVSKGRGMGGKFLPKLSLHKARVMLNS